MNLKQCNFCKLPFQSYGRNICPKCMDKIDEDFITIKEYLYDNPGSPNVSDLEKATGVEKKVILHLIEEQRLSFAGPIEGGAVCEMCHKPIVSGRMCEGCRASVSKALSGTLPQPKASAPKETTGRTVSRMHVDHKNK